MSRRFPEWVLDFAGHTFIALSYGGVKELTFDIGTNDSRIAAQLGFVDAPAHLNCRYVREVSVSEVDRWVERVATGTYQGEEVRILEDDGHKYRVAFEGDLPGLERYDFNMYLGWVPHSKVSQVRITEKVRKE